MFDSKERQKANDRTNMASLIASAWAENLASRESALDYLSERMGREVDDGELNLALYDSGRVIFD